MRVRLLYLPPNKILKPSFIRMLLWYPSCIVVHTDKTPSRCHGEEIISSSPKVLVTGLNKTMQRPF
ncbi:hypothetical protein Felix01p090 [Salmonella phage FelixO1]|uniref:Uncharacterized protein n=4 Tax=root TaxID=1 RepID=Q6KGL1_BPFO1|nr:hypothetical protein Felix01p090 [Salmonella phage FelixO1]AAQ14656.1 unknown [Salmonella phage FelixO1]AEO97463.1 gp45 [Salmonella phage FO1a]HAD1134147.1 hypothetical protein [Salmonella enterica subsp. enterica serovar Typhimurium]